MKLFTKTFGCQMNFADSDEMGRAFKERGFQTAESEQNADAILVNTCTVRDLAEHKAASFIGRLRDWKDEHPNGLIVVTGCAAERAKNEFRSRFPHIDLIVGAKDIAEFPKELDAFLQKNGIASEPKTSQFLGEFALASSPRLSVTGQENSLEAPSGVIQYVTIMRGCNYNCTYCIVPSVRGREVYRPVSDILADVKARTAEGAREIWLLGQTVNSYRPSEPPTPGYDFADLLRDVNAVPGVGRVRFMSPHPYYLTPKLIAAMAECANVCEHIHLPVQSGSNQLLARMKRNYTRESYLEGVKRLRAAIPSISITTDIIVGFPGETGADFEATKQLVLEAGFDSAYCFKYSPRPGTASAAMPDDVPDDVKEARVNELLALTDNQGRVQAEKLIGSVQEILLEDDKGDGLFRGKTRSSWRARLKHPSIKIGQFVKARIVSTHSRELHAELVAPV
jgi:tRNA-2-methylthio-N6-dimethylallyladenosine synthase